MSALEYHYMLQKQNYDAVRGSLVGILYMMVKLDLIDKYDRPDRILPEYINDHAKTEKITRINKRAKRFA